MLPQAGRKIVVARKIFFGTHEDIIMLFVVQDCLKRTDAWHVDWAGWQTFVFVGIIGRINLLVLIKDALKTEVANRKDKGWVGLQGNTLF